MFGEGDGIVKNLVCVVSAGMYGICLNSRESQIGGSCLTSPRYIPKWIVLVVWSCLLDSGVARGARGAMPPQTFGKCFFPEWIDVVTWFECVSRRGKCPWISVSVHKRRVIRRWPENVQKMSRNRGNVIDLLTGKISATTPPPPHWIRSEITKNVCYYTTPPSHWLRSAPGEMTENVPGGPPPKQKSLLRRCSWRHFMTTVNVFWTVMLFLSMKSKPPLLNVSCISFSLSSCNGKHLLVPTGK